MTYEYLRKALAGAPDRRVRLSTPATHDGEVQSAVLAIPRWFNAALVDVQ